MAGKLLTWARLLLLNRFFIGLTSILMLVILYRQCGHGAHFRKAREDSKAHLLQTASDTLAVFIQNYVSNADSLARAKKFQTQLSDLIDKLDQLENTDRSISYDYVFDAFSLLLAIATLLGGGIGIFMGLQYHELRKEMKEIEAKVVKIKGDANKHFQTAVKNIDKKVEESKDEIQNHVQDARQDVHGIIDRTRAELQRLETQGNEANFTVAAGLERLVNILKLDDTDFTQIMSALYRTLYRSQLDSPDPKERDAALRFFYAQGTCDDLGILQKICKDEKESSAIRQLARLTIQENLKRCSHPGGHPDLDFSSCIKNRVE